MDIWGMDVARFGDWANLAYTNAKVRENYSRRFRITFPNEELAAARPLHTTPDLRPAHRAQRRVGRRVRPRAPVVVPASGRGARRGGHVPSFQRVPDRGRGVPCRARARRPHGVLELRQVQGDRRRQRGLAAGVVHQPASQGRADRADRDAQPAGAHRRRVLGRPGRRRRVLPVRLAGRRGAPFALVPRPPPGRQRDPLRGARPVARRSVGRRPARPRRAAVGDGRVARHRGLPVHDVPADRHRDDPGVGRPDDVHRRSRLRDLGGARAPAGAVRRAVARRAARTAWRCSGSGR